MPLVPTYSSGFSFFLTIALSGSWISNYKRGKNANPPGFKPVSTGAKDEYLFYRFATYDF